MEFVGQFPLDPARDAGLLPFDVPPRSMLTVFWTCEMENVGSTLNQALTIHSTDDLVELQSPDAAGGPSPLYAIEMEIGDLYPCAAEALEIIQWECELRDQAPLSTFRSHYEKLFPNPTDVSRIGGYPSWIQSPEEIQFVAQICSDEISDLNFGDGGSLYIHGDSPDALSAFIRCY